DQEMKDVFMKALKDIKKEKYKRVVLNVNLENENEIYEQLLLGKQEWGSFSRYIKALILSDRFDSKKK
ncbi:MAG: hypothetical protein II739_08520, partial [Clostridia bacterium]|nr:hypothetical protein [Clostridia bacterium]